METILTVLGGILGLVVPVLFAVAMNQGVSRSSVDDAQTSARRRAVIITTALWTTAVWVASLGHAMSYHPGDRWPRVAVPLVVPVLAALALLLHPTVKAIVNNIPVATLVGVQAFRLAGFVFFIIPALGLLPPAFVIGGYGDVATGLLAILAGLMLAKNAAGAGAVFVLFSTVGMLDLLNVAALLLYFYPTWTTAEPTSAALADFSLVMVPALAAPIALILHIYAITNQYLRQRGRDRDLVALQSGAE